MQSFSIALFTAFVCGVSCNDPPQLQHNYVFDVKENVPVGTIIGRITAVDLDGPQELTFTTSNQLTSEIISLTNPIGSSSIGRSVDMVLNRMLDRELRTDYDLEFDVTDGYNKVHFYVKLFCQDINDNSPRFLSPSYSKAISSRSPVGMIVLIVVASDIDSGLGGQIQYTLESDDASDLTYFFINTQAGLLMTKAPLINILYHEFKMRAVATDGYGLQGSVNVTITVSSYAIPTPPPKPSLVTPSPPPVTGRGFLFG
ncbi:hypothetical protein CHS0354_001011 [Potamilus streckersoni]|uniref:Cadherin domain-containing protein n=1 Tax=Potamilus streckersoni TaxID=2493646 RepID=A0AAE0RUS8_9BIVA|nr:hypothetical protein CHS0354_001011 [Potamilus streckersoni]